MEEGGQWLEASLEVLKECIYVVKFYLLDGLSKHPRKVPY